MRLVSGVSSCFPTPIVISAGVAEACPRVVRSPPSLEEDFGDVGSESTGCGQLTSSQFAAVVSSKYGQPSLDAGRAFTRVHR